MSAFTVRNLAPTPSSVRAEPVEALSFLFLTNQEEGQGFDKLSPNGV